MRRRDTKEMWTDIVHDKHLFDPTEFLKFSKNIFVEFFKMLSEIKSTENDFDEELVKTCWSTSFENLEASSVTMGFRYICERRTV
jgi:hypothetical protein